MKDEPFNLGPDHEIEPGSIILTYDINYGWYSHTADDHSAFIVASLGILKAPFGRIYAELFINNKNYGHATFFEKTYSLGQCNLLIVAGSQMRLVFKDSIASQQCGIYMGDEVYAIGGRVRRAVAP